MWPKVRNSGHGWRTSGSQDPRQLKILVPPSLLRQVPREGPHCTLLALFMSDSFRPQGAHQAPLSMGLSRQEYGTGLLFLHPGDLPKPGIEPVPPTLHWQKSEKVYRPHVPPFPGSLPLIHQGGPGSLIVLPVPFSMGFVIFPSSDLSFHISCLRRLI